MTSRFDKGPNMFFTGNVSAPKNIIEGKWELPIDSNPSKILLEKKFGVPLKGINCIQGTFELRTPPGGYAEIKKHFGPEIPPRKQPGTQDIRGTRKVTLDSTEILEPQDDYLPNPRKFGDSVIMTKKDGKGGDPRVPVNYGDDPCQICPGDNLPPLPSKWNDMRIVGKDAKGPVPVTYGDDPCNICPGDNLPPKPKKWNDMRIVGKDAKGPVPVTYGDDPCNICPGDNLPPKPKKWNDMRIVGKDAKGPVPVTYGDDPCNICPGDNLPPKQNKLSDTRPAIPPRKIDGKIPNITPYKQGTTDSGPGKITNSNNSTPYKTIQSINPKTPGKVPNITPYTPVTNPDPRKRLNPSNNSTPYNNPTQMTLKTPKKPTQFLKTDTPDTANHLKKSPGRTPNSKTPGRTPNSGVRAPSQYTSKPSPRPSRRNPMTTSPFYQNPREDSPEAYGKACCAFHPIAPKERLFEVKAVKDYKNSVLPVSFFVLIVILDQNNLS